MMHRLTARAACSIAGLFIPATAALLMLGACSRSVPNMAPPHSLAGGTRGALVAPTPPSGLPTDAAEVWSERRTGWMRLGTQPGEPARPADPAGEHAGARRLYVAGDGGVGRYATSLSGGIYAVFADFAAGAGDRAPWNGQIVTAPDEVVVDRGGVYVSLYWGDPVSTAWARVRGRRLGVEGPVVQVWPRGGARVEVAVQVEETFERFYLLTSVPGPLIVTLTGPDKPEPVLLSAPGWVECRREAGGWVLERAAGSLDEPDADAERFLAPVLHGWFRSGQVQDGPRGGGR